MVFCHACGTRIDQPGARFCFSCGTAIVQVSSTPAAPAPVPVAVAAPAPPPAAVPSVAAAPASTAPTKRTGRCTASTKGRSTPAYVCYNCGYGSHAESDCVVCSTFMRVNKQEAALCVDCGWTTFPENCAHCNAPLGSTKIKTFVCTDCSSGANQHRCCKLKPM